MGSTVSQVTERKTDGLTNTTHSIGPKVGPTSVSSLWMKWKFDRRTKKLKLKHDDSLYICWLENFGKSFRHPQESTCVLINKLSYNHIIPNRKSNILSQKFIEGKTMTHNGPKIFIFGFGDMNSLKRQVIFWKKAITILMIFIESSAWYSIIPKTTGPKYFHL